MTRRSFWNEIKDIRWETDSSSCIATTRRPIVKQNIDLLMQESNITICNDPSRRKFDFHVKVFDKDGKFIVGSVSSVTRKTGDRDVDDIVLLVIMYLIGHQHVKLVTNTFCLQHRCNRKTHVQITYILFNFRKLWSKYKSIRVQRS